MTFDIPVEPEEFDADWLTSALGAAGVAQGATITALAFDGYVGTGQMSRNSDRDASGVAFHGPSPDASRRYQVTPL